jgi:OmcA/MtrC family decaheme c-type cytochrome
MVYSRLAACREEQTFWSTVCQSAIACIRFPLLVLLSLLVAACGSDGDDGADGEPGTPGKPGAAPTALTATFTSAAVAGDGRLTVNLSLTDEDGGPYAYLASSSARFTVAKLNAAGDLGAGESSSWQSYINRTENPPTDPSNGPGTVAQTQATSESNGTFTNNGDGTYTYVFSTNLKSVTSPVAVTYDSGATHRVAVQISGGDVPVANATHDWLPLTGASTGLVTRNMVASETCNSCHGDLAIHGGGRTDTNYCVTCHNPGSVDANSGNTVDFKVMVHKIHKGATLPSVAAGGEYAIWGFRDSKHDYSDVHFPQDVRQCRNCHDENNVKTPDASNWMMFPTAEACGSCHDDVNFETGANHVAGARTNAECSTCHVGDESNQLTVARSHDISGYAEAKGLLAVRVDATAIDPTNGDVQLAVSLVNPSDGSVYTQKASDLPFLNRARIYRNPVDSNTGYLDALSYYDIEALTPDAAGQYTIDTDIVLASDQLLAFSSRFQVCTDEKDGGLLDCTNASKVNAGVNATWGNVDTTGALLSATNELQVGADYERCETCHADPTIGVHGGDYSTLQQCRACHNNSFLRTGRRAGNLDLKFVIHAFHAGNLNDSNSATGKAEMHYPDSIANCSQCHSESQLDLPIAANTWAPETSAGLFTSPTAFVCSSCHLTTQPGVVDVGNLGALPAADQSMVGHMIQNGAVFNGSQSAANVTESCAVCHSSGSLAAIDKAHDTSAE